MQINFLMPCYTWTPSGGFRVVYEYANRLVARGHRVTVIHPRRLKFPPPPSEERLPIREQLRRTKVRLRDFLSTPTIDWHQIDERVNLAFVPSSDPMHIPNGDILFATAWHTVRSVLECHEEKGRPCYLIQGYETWLGPKKLVDDTWHAPLRKVVIADWLLKLGQSMGCRDLTYIPNAIDHRRYKITRPIAGRSQRVAMILSLVPLKGARDGVRALEIAKEKFPQLRVSLFGDVRRPAWIPAWMDYERKPTQDRIVQHCYNGSSIFLSSSWMEGFALPPAEAAACGCAIVSTDTGGIREYVQDGVTGLLSPPKEAEALANNLCFLLENEQIRERLAVAANAAVQKLNWEHSTDRLESFMTA